jgi:hypothetical protein
MTPHKEPRLTGDVLLCLLPCMLDRPCTHKRVFLDVLTPSGADLAEREGIIAMLLALPDVRSVKEFPATAANK